jgi:hypothetical protein
MALMLPRTIRLDPSDTFVYARPAEPGEWAVTGTFRFFGADLSALDGKARQAFRGGFLGVASFGWSTLVVVSEASDEDRRAAVEALAGQLVAHCGAPDIETARIAAAEEVDFARSLCDHPQGTLLGLHRAAEEQAIRETFRTLHRRADRLQPLGAFQLVEIEGEEELPEERIDLLALAGKARR